MYASFKKHTLQFITPGGTSRGVLHTKDSWLIFIESKAKSREPGIMGIGECSIIPKLSIDDVPELENVIEKTVKQINENNFSIVNFPSSLTKFPALRFALEMALLDLKNGGTRTLFPSAFTQGKAAIPINGLIWMGDFDAMWKQAEQKFKDGFSVLKMKIGALDFDEEMYFIAQLRRHFPQIELRLDANGGFPLEEAPERLEALAQFRIHSIEQPIKQGNISRMAALCRRSPIDIALDEELIGVEVQRAASLLKEIKPKYVILKPSLLGGFQVSDEWIAAAESQHIRWWATSALESNIGLNAIAQWTFTKNNLLPQGLGTGGVFSNNIEMGLKVERGELKCVCHQ
ncbi:MAG: o-succinylbenzoate synthase [Prevotellaceae bacterium]|jgi:o-succinylbenzoate synthase|nr:o-succinylbenzoate synthase [Prevotellaceae bacterium]